MKPPGSATVRKLTHAGGVVFRLASEDAEFLVVQSSRNDSWVLPKGRIEAGETPERTAVREVREEAGVVARPIEPLGEIAFATPREPVRARFFLMRFEHTAPADEQRGIAWLPYAHAIARLTFENQRQLLAQARRRIDADR